MISHFTWPNFKSGTDKDGVRVLIEEKGFSHDVKYGKTKLFIKSPGTLFKLEKVYFTVLLLNINVLFNLYICFDLYMFNLYILFRRTSMEYLISSQLILYVW